MSTAKKTERTFVDQVAGEDFFLPAQDVRKIIGVDAGSFQQWLARELIPFETVTAGKRVWRRFHVREIPRLVLASAIWKTGLLISQAIEIADLILKGIKKGKSPNWILYFVHDDKGVVYFYYKGQHYPSSRLFQDFNSASCILISIEELDRQIGAALLLAKRVTEAQ